MKNLFILLLIAIVNPLIARDFYKMEKDNLLLDNGEVSRKITIRNDSLYSTYLSLVSDEYNYILKSRDFSFTINDKQYNGYSGWKLVSTEKIVDPAGGNGVKVRLKESGDNPDLEIEINYMLYPGLPLIRKWMKFTNIGSQDLKLESLCIEYFITNLRPRDNVVYHDYARMKHLGRFVSNWYDPIVVVHEITNRRGIALGNETFGVLKRTAYHTERYSDIGFDKSSIEIGLTKPGQSYPFRKWLEPGKSWESPKVFICLYTNRDDGYLVVEEEVNEFMVKYMKPIVNRLSPKPTFMYDDLRAAPGRMNETVAKEIGKAVADCGIQLFIFEPNILLEQFKPICDYLDSLGIKPGLWMAAANISENSEVFQKHPEWMVTGPAGKPEHLHHETEDGRYTAAFTTGWYDYLKRNAFQLINDHSITYMKIDLAAVTSAYVNNDSISGSYGQGDPLIRDHEESFIELYDRMLQFFDDLHREHPEVYIDLTFETAGKLQLIDYAGVQHAHGNWVSNFFEPYPLGPLRVRQLAWWRSPAIPASSLVIGNQQIQDPGVELSIKSLIGTIPILIGDPRQVPEERRKIIKDWVTWTSRMQDKYDFMPYRKDLTGFGQPQEGSWDGWQRINFQTREGGIFGIFRQGALEDSRQVFLKDLKPDKNYVIKLAPYDESIMKATGKELMEKGFSVKLSEKYDANIYEVGIE